MTAPVPFAPKPSIVDRVLGRLFPTAQYAGLLDQSQQQGLQHQGLLNLGMGVLSQSGAGSGPFISLGKAYQGLDFSGMADHALALQSLRSQQQEQQAIAAVAQHHPAVPSETPVAIHDRLVAMATEMAGIPGGARLAEQMSGLIAATKPDRPLQAREPQHLPAVETRLGFPNIGQKGEYLIPYPGAPKSEWTFVLGMQPNAEMKPTPQQQQHAEFGAAALAAWNPVERIRTQNPGVEEEVGKIFASPAFAHAVPGFRNSGDAVTALQKAGASPAAQNYMRAKWSFLDNILRTRYATGRLGGPMLQQLGQEFMPGLDIQGNAQVRQNELQAILSAQGESGFDANPTFWNNAIKRHGVAGVDLQDLLAGGGGDQRLNTIQSRYK